MYPVAFGCGFLFGGGGGHGMLGREKLKKLI